MESSFSRKCPISERHEKSNRSQCDGMPFNVTQVHLIKFYSWPKRLYSLVEKNVMESLTLTNDVSKHALEPLFRFRWTNNIDAVYSNFYELFSTLWSIISYNNSCALKKTSTSLEEYASYKMLFDGIWETNETLTKCRSTFYMRSNMLFRIKEPDRPKLATTTIFQCKTRAPIVINYSMWISFGSFGCT